MQLRTLTGILMCLFWVGSATAAPLAGKASLEGVGVAGVKVQAWPLASHAFSGPPPFVAGPTRQDGLFEMDLPAGQYYLLAENDELFSYYGRNPVAVSASGVTDINLPMALRAGTQPDNEPRVLEGAMGLTTRNGKPVPGVFAYVYTDLTSQLKGFGMGVSAPTMEDGFFEVPLPSGTYYLVARMRQSGGPVGPLRAGDLFGYYPGNPIQVAEGQMVRVHIPLIEVPENVSRHADTLFGHTRIRGRVLDVEGKPVAGIKALLYVDSAMLDRPLYVSQPTGTDGTFILSFPEGGTYYLAARDKLGGTPAPGELYGRYQGGGDASIHVVSGKEKSGVEIRVEEVW